jgi:hypothetical protein
MKRPIAAGDATDAAATVNLACASVPRRPLTFDPGLLFDQDREFARKRDEHRNSATWFTPRIQVAGLSG